VLQLRQSILEEAIQGKLAPQDPNDEPASFLLERIRAEKEQMIKEKKIKKEKPFPKITEDEIPFDLPQGWEWVRLGDICEIITKGSSPKWQGVNYIENENGVLFITSENVGNYSLLLNNRKYVEHKFNEIEPRSILKKGDILMNIVGASIGRTAEYDLDETANVNQAVCIIRLVNSDQFKKYLLYFFNSSLCLSYMFNKQVDNARANLSMGNISKFIIPIPPLNEQRQIVKRIDQLMVLCNELEKKVDQSKLESEKLIQSVLREAFSEATNVDNVVNFSKANTNDREDWEIAARSYGEINTDTKAKIKNRVNELLGKLQE
jgi:type I restriction enzyme S subunit